MGMLFVRQLGVGPHVTPVREPNTSIEELWQAPQDLANRNLFVGSTAHTSPPTVNQPMMFLSQKTTGFSPGYDVKDAQGREWSVKLGPEAQTEVVASRLLWALGYHQPPTYYVASWALTGGPSEGAQPGARFRPKGRELKSDGDWSWQHNPFVGTQPYRGLLVMMLMLNSTDLRNENNVIYETKGRAPQQWYAIKDLGATFGATGVYRPSRNDVAAFESDPFVKNDSDGHTKLTYHGLQKELLAQLTASDVRWTCDLLSQLSDRQWHDAFRAGGYSDDVATRYIAALHDRIQAGRTLDDSFDGRRADYGAARQLRRGAHVVHAVGTLFRF
jgi:hypothetical protein